MINWNSNSNTNIKWKVKYVHNLNSLAWIDKRDSCACTKDKVISNGFEKWVKPLFEFFGCIMSFSFFVLS